MRRSFALGAIIAAVLTLAVAGLAVAKWEPVVVKAGNLELTFNGGLTPEAVSKTKLTPVTFDISGKIRTLNGEHPPALKEFLLEADKNTDVDVTGLPTCSASKLQAQDTKHAEAACKPAIIGVGQAKAEIAFPDQPPIPATSKIIAFNGGKSGATTTFYIHAFLTVPTPAAVVSTVKITKVRNGRYGVKSVTTVPKIAGGTGSVVDFNLKINKRGVILAKCPDGKIQAHGTAVFSDTTKVSADVIRPCVGKG
jgi:hypothetical protein